MANWCLNVILISGPSEDVSVIYKSLEEYKDEVKAKEKEPDENQFNIGSWIKDKFSDKLPEFTEKDYELSYRNFIEDYSYLEGAYNDKAYLAIRSESPLVSRMYALVKLIEVGFPKCIINYKIRKSYESRFYFPEWYYSNKLKSVYYMSDEELYRTLINDYADIIKDNNIVIPELVNTEVSQIHELANSLSEYDEDLICIQIFNWTRVLPEKDRYSYRKLFCNTPNWCMNTILISGPREDVSVLYKSLKEYTDEVKSKGKEPATNTSNICSWIMDKFSDKLHEFTEDDYELSYTNVIESYLYDVYDSQADLVIQSESTLDSRMYALVKLIEVGFPKCIINYKSEGPIMEYYINTDESGKYFPERWYYTNRFKSVYYMSDEDMYRTLINDYADIIKDNNIVIPSLDNPSQDQICKLVESLVEFDEELCVHPFSIGPEYDYKNVDNIESVGV